MFPSPIAFETISVALASASASRSRASASRNAASRRPSALRICACFSPSAFKISDCRTPSASRITARLSRSAFIWRAMASTSSVGGVMSLISMRVIFTPQGEVASSTTLSRSALILSRCDRSSSRSIDPITVRILVIVRLRIASSSRRTS